MAILYEILMPDGKKYIGASSMTLSARLRCHRGAARKGSKQQIHISMRNFGDRNYSAKVLAIGEKDFILELEEKAILAFNTIYPNGLNIFPGGKNQNRFLKHSDASKILIADSKRGVPRPDLIGEKNPSSRPEVVAKIKASLAGRTVTGMLGRNHLPETILKMKNKIWVNDGKISKKINSESVVQEGWTKGRIVDWSTRK